MINTNDVKLAAKGLKAHLYQLGYEKWEQNEETAGYLTYAKYELARKRYLSGLIENVTITPMRKRTFVNEATMEKLSVPIETFLIQVKITSKEYDESPYNCTVSFAGFEVLVRRKYV